VGLSFISIYKLIINTNKQSLSRRVTCVSVTPWAMGHRATLTCLLSSENLNRLQLHVQTNIAGGNSTVWGNNGQPWPELMSCLFDPYTNVQLRKEDISRINQRENSIKKNNACNGHLSSPIFSQFYFTISLSVWSQFWLLDAKKTIHLFWLAVCVCTNRNHSWWCSSSRDSLMEHVP